MSNNEHDRAALLRVIEHVRPALARQPYIPALTHVRFGGGRALACNDVAAISVRCDVTTFDRLVPGELLARALTSFAGEAVLLQQTDSHVTLVSGRATKVKLPTLPADDFPFSMPDDDGSVIELGASSVEAIRRCLVAVSADGKHPAQLGVTLDCDEDGIAVFYSTDNWTMTRATTTDRVKLPGGAPVLLPTFLCEQAVRLAAAFKEDEIDLVVYPGGLLVEVGKHALVFSKTLVDLEPLDFPKAFARLVGSEQDLAEMLGAIPEGFDSAVDRAAMVMQGETQKGAEIVPGDGVFLLRASGSLGESDDRLKFDGDCDVPPLRVDPSHLARGAKACASMALMPRCVAMHVTADGPGKDKKDRIEVTHLISLVS